MNPQAYLNSFINFESHLHNVSSRLFNLDRVHRLLTALGNPQKNLKFVHVAGTKGKGSTCIFISYILRAAGYRVGLYTSPHLFRINERIRVLESGTKIPQHDFSGSISNRQLAVVLKKIRPVLEKFRYDAAIGNLTYFEALTAVALYCFARQNVDIVVLETGLGGRLDATNAVDALVNVITPIGFDHTHLLGNTLENIAREKAAIIKSSFSKVVVSEQDPKAMKVILKRCRDLKIKPVLVAKHVKCLKGSEKPSFNVRGQYQEYKDLKTVLLGNHQRQNAAAAIAVIELLPKFGFVIAENAVRQGILQARWPGRFEIVKKSPTTIIDCAHNVDSAKALVRTFRDAFPKQKAVLLLGVSTDKDVNGICRVLNAIAHTVVLTRADHPRAHVFEVKETQELFKRKIVMDLPDVRKAVRQAYKSAGLSGMVLVAGSVFLAAEVRAEVKHVSI